MQTVEIVGKGGLRVIERKHLEQYLSKGYLVADVVVDEPDAEPVEEEPKKRKRSKE